MLKWSRDTTRKLTVGRSGGGIKLESTLCEVFHENTKLTPLSGRVLGARAAAFTESPLSRRLVATPYKTYTLMERAVLPSVQARGDLEETILRRRSYRSFDGRPLELAELARLLYLTYGVVSRRGARRPIASGGALYPLEFYVIATHVDGLREGTYHYNVEAHCLDVVRHETINSNVVQRLVWLDDIEDQDAVACIVVIAAMLPRTTIKYGDRGYRLVLLEAGEAVHNLALLATSAGLGCCALGGFMDNALSEFLDMDGVDEVPLVPIVFGRRKAETNGPDE